MTETLISGCNNEFFTQRPAGHYETHVSTFNYAAQTHPRIPGPHEDAQRARGAAGAARQRAQAARRLTDSAGRFSFSRARRLDGPGAYAAVFAFKCSVCGGLFQVHARPNGAAAPRLGIVVSKRTVPQAVARNYCKRLTREVFRAEIHSLAQTDFVIRPRTLVTRAMSAAARAEIRNLLHRAQGKCRQN